MRTLLTGSTGFLGGHLLEALQKDGSVTPLRGDLLDDATTSSLPDVDVVQHLAAVSSVPASVEDPMRTWEVNAGGTLRLLEWARRHDVGRFVLVSTAHVYGPATYSPIDERHPTRPVSPYGASKLAAEAMARAYHATYGLETVIVRPFNIYGPGQAAGFLIPDILLPITKGRAPALGDPRPVRDFTYVSDAVDFLVKAGSVKGIAGLELNLGTGVGHPVREVAETAVAVTGLPLAPTFDTSRVRAAEVSELVVDNRLAMERLGWKPQVDLREGLRRTWDAMRKAS